jgi:hypothetical protein
MRITAQARRMSRVPSPRSILAPPVLRTPTSTTERQAKQAIEASVATAKSCGFRYGPYRIKANNPMAANGMESLKNKSVMWSARRFLGGAIAFSKEVRCQLRD